MFKTFVSLLSGHASYKEIETFPLIQEDEKYLRHLLGRYGTLNNRNSENREFTVL